MRICGYDEEKICKIAVEINYIEYCSLDDTLYFVDFLGNDYIISGINFYLAEAILIELMNCGFYFLDDEYVIVEESEDV